MPPRYVKPCVKRNKNDAADAEAICEAVTRPTMRFVPVKTIEQLSVLMLHRTRQLFIRQRTTIINSIRAHLAEFGIVAGIGRNGVEALLGVIAKGEEQGIPPEARSCLMALAAQLELSKGQILEMDRRVLAWHRSNTISRQLEGIPGIGPLTSTASVASIPDPKVFRSGRDLSAWIGLVPTQNSAGGKEKLGGILERMLLNGTRSAESIMASGHRRVPHLKAGHMADPTSDSASGNANTELSTHGAQGTLAHVEPDGYCGRTDKGLQ